MEATTVVNYSKEQVTDGIIMLFGMMTDDDDDDDDDDGDYDGDYDGDGDNDIWCCQRSQSCLRRGG